MDKKHFADIDILSLRPPAAFRDIALTSAGLSKIDTQSLRGEFERLRKTDPLAFREEMLASRQLISGAAGFVPAHIKGLTGSKLIPHLESESVLRSSSVLRESFSGFFADRWRELATKTLVADSSRLFASPRPLGLMNFLSRQDGIGALLHALPSESDAGDEPPPPVINVVPLVLVPPPSAERDKYVRIEIDEDSSINCQLCGSPIDGTMSMFLHRGRVFYQGEIMPRCESCLGSPDEPLDDGPSLYLLRGEGQGDLQRAGKLRLVKLTRRNEE